MKSKTDKTSLKDKAKMVLIGMAENISREDKNLAVDKLGINRVTVFRYLNGDVKDIGTTEKLIAFFKPIVEQRKKTIAA